MPDISVHPRNGILSQLLKYALFNESEQKTEEKTNQELSKFLQGKQTHLTPLFTAFTIDQVIYQIR